MKTSKITLTAVAVLLAAAATAADAGVRFRNVDSIVGRTQNGGEIIVAVNITCGNGAGNFVMETDRNTNELYRGCAHLEGDRVIVNWNDGTTYSYAPSLFHRTTSWLNV
jgi:hypothetical protein